MEITDKGQNIMVHNLSYNFDVCLDVRIIKFVYNALNHSHWTCHNLLHTKLNIQFKFNFFRKYQYFSYKYQLSDRDWYSDFRHLLGKVKMEIS